MADPEPTYNERIVQAREQILERVRSGRLDRVREAIARALAQVQQEAPNGPLTPETAQQLRQQYEAALQQLRSDLVAATEQQRSQAVQEEADAHEEALIAAALAAGLFGSEDEARQQVPPVGQWAPRFRERVRLHIQVRRGLSDDMDPEGYITRIVSSVGSEIDSAIGAATGESGGVEEAAQKTASEVARDIGAAIADDDLSGALDSVGLGALVDEDSSFDLQSAKQLGSNLRRVISHEVAHVADEAGKTLAALNPAVKYSVWELSARHHTLESSPDVCDVLANADLYGHGEGVYPKSVVPSLPHPHCECRQRVVLKDPSDWFGGDDRPVPDEPDIGEAAVRDLMDDMDGERTVTGSHVANQSDMLRRVLSAVHENPRGRSLDD